MHACRADAASPGLGLIGRWAARDYQKFPSKADGDPISKEAKNGTKAGTVSVVASDISYNQVLGGLGDGDGTDGLGVGGGVYNLGTFLFDAVTVIAHNHSSTSNNDCFGC